MFYLSIAMPYHLLYPNDIFLTSCRLKNNSASYFQKCKRQLSDLSTAATYSSESEAT